MCGLYCTTSLHLCGFVEVYNVWVILYHLTAPVWVCGVHNVWVILYHLTVTVWVCGVQHVWVILYHLTAPLWVCGGT